VTEVATVPGGGGKMEFSGGNTSLRGISLTLGGPPTDNITLPARGHWDGGYREKRGQAKTRQGNRSLKKGLLT